MLFFIVFGIAVVSIIIQAAKGSTGNVSGNAHYDDAGFQLHQQAHQDAQDLHRIAHNAAVEQQWLGHNAAMDHHHTAIDMSMHMHM